MIVAMKIAFMLGLSGFTAVFLASLPGSALDPVPPKHVWYWVFLFASWFVILSAFALWAGGYAEVVWR